MMRGVLMAEHLNAMARSVDECLVCRTTHLAETLVLVKSPCGCDVLMCKACQRSPGTVKWLKHYACACRQCAKDLALELSA